MKAIRLFMATCLILTILPASGWAQKNTSPVPAKGNWMIELNINPLGGEDVIVFNKLHTKYWLSDKAVLRLGFELSAKNNGIKESDYRDEDVDKSNFKEKSFLFGINPGIEYRFLPGRRVSPYIGAEISYRQKRSSSEYVSYSRDYNGELTSIITTKYDNSWKDTERVYYGGGYYYNVNTYPERSFNSFGAALLLGCDFFIVRNMSLGLELGLGYENMRYKRAESDSTVVYTDSSKPSVNTKATYLPGRKSSVFSFYSNNLIRIGIWF